MTAPVADAPAPKVFGPRRRRALLSFRRKSDLVWFLVSVGMFVSGLTSLVYTLGQWRRPVVVERLVEREVPSTPVPRETSRPAPAPAVEQTDEGPFPLESPVEKEPEFSPAPSSVSVKEKNTKGTKPLRWSLLEEKKFFLILFDRDARLTATATEVSGDPAVRLEYDFQSGRWVQAFVTLNRDFSKYARVRFAFKVEGADNTVEFKMVDADGTNVGASWTHRAGKSGWTEVSLPLKDLKYLWGGDGRMDWSQTRQIYFAVSRKSGDEGGKGRVTIRGVTFS